MKKLGLFCVLFSSIVILSCNKAKKEEVNPVIEEKPISVQCYQALCDTDTIQLKLNNLKSGKITGDMLMKIDNMPLKKGKIAGEFRGDTLFASYTFTQGENETITFKNPMAFLKRADTLVLGNGKIQTTMGASYFVKGEPIDFDRVRYKFLGVDCK